MTRQQMVVAAVLLKLTSRNLFLYRGIPPGNVPLVLRNAPAELVDLLLKV
jgi:hypothetical protein